MVLLADQVGWSWTVLALLALSGLGVVVIRGSGRAAAGLARSTQSMPVSAVPAAGGRAADAGFRLLAGVLLVIPGFVTGLCGLLLLFPPARALARVLAGNAMIRRYPTMQATVTRVRLLTDPGDVIPGEVVDPDSTEGPEEPPPALS